MKSVTVNVWVSKQITLNPIPSKWKKWFEAWFADDEERTGEQWDLVDTYGLNEVMSDILDKEVNESEIDDYE